MTTAPSALAALEHTPGPWRAELNDQGNGIVWAVRSGDDDKYIVAVASVGPTETRLANANLIAACPTMLEYIQSSASGGCTTAAQIVRQINDASEPKFIVDEAGNTGWIIP